MITLLVISVIKYMIHVVDLSLENGWAGKNANIFYVDLIGELCLVWLLMMLEPLWGRSL